MDSWKKFDQICDFLLRTGSVRHQPLFMDKEAKKKFDDFISPYSKGITSIKVGEPLIDVDSIIYRGFEFVIVELTDEPVHNLS
jgi:hypothetical protein